MRCCVVCGKDITYTVFQKYCFDCQWIRIRGNYQRYLDTHGGTVAVGSCEECMARVWRGKIPQPCPVLTNIRSYCGLRGQP